MSYFLLEYLILLLRNDDTTFSCLNSSQSSWNFRWCKSLRYRICERYTNYILFELRKKKTNLNWNLVNNQYLSTKIVLDFYVGHKKNEKNNSKTATVEHSGAFNLKSIRVLMCLCVDVYIDWF